MKKRHGNSGNSQYIMMSVQMGSVVLSTLSLVDRHASCQTIDEVNRGRCHSIMLTWHFLFSELSFWQFPNHMKSLSKQNTKSHLMIMDIANAGSGKVEELREGSFEAKIKFSLFHSEGISSCMREGRLEPGLILECHQIIMTTFNSSIVNESNSKLLSMGA